MSGKRIISDGVAMPVPSFPRQARVESAFCIFVSASGTWNKPVMPHIRGG